MPIISKTTSDPLNGDDDEDIVVTKEMIDAGAHILWCVPDPYDEIPDEAMAAAYRAMFKLRPHEEGCDADC